MNSWHKASLARVGVDKLIDQRALTHLARILGWQNHHELLFTYPPFSKGYFMQPVQFSDLQARLPGHIRVATQMKMNDKQAREIAEALFDIKKPIHFRYYQEQAEGWNIIKARKP